MKISHLALGAATLAAASPALASTDDTTTEDTTIEDTAADRRPERTIIVTGTPTIEQVETVLERTPGGVDIISDEDFKDTPVQHIEDILRYAPGVITQRRMGDDARISIRGSGLSRAYGVRGIAVLLDGIPMNTSDGLMDFFEIDPSAYRYVEVYRGSNALRYGANVLGGAINLVTPTGRDAATFEGRVDAGSFGYVKSQASTGGVSGDLDYFVTASVQTIDGYRDHSGGDAVRANANLGYRFSEGAATRFYVTAASTDQRIPGEVSKDTALNDPRAANPVWVLQDQQRNVDSIRISNKTGFAFGSTAVDVGAFYNWRHVDHPIYQYLDYTVDDYGVFARAVDERSLGGFENRLVAGINLHNGVIDTEQFVNQPGAVKGPLAASMIDRSGNFSIYAENSLSVLSDLALIAGVQYLHTTRDREDRFLANGDQSGRRVFDLWSPKFGVLWDVTQEAQVFANISRSAEVPSYDANVTTAVNLQAQRATTYEVGTRGKVAGIGWDLALYRSELRDELQCLTTGPFSACSIVNAPRTVHQGIEAGLSGSIPIGTKGDTLALTGAYTFSDFSFDDDPIYGDNELPGVPSHILNAEIVFAHRSGFYAGPSLEWVPASYFADNANTLTVDPYALLGFKAGYDTGSGLSFYLEGRNLTDRRYISTVAVAGTASPTSELFNPGTGRAVFGGVRARF
ncbi:TonB-dependent receptor family protein [Aurantiacibacter zhengii]|uniref:TonB-dependent receptor n=1 Tax=Aurantiacibacter zhengii TaxID=2307003 RepID=A0A418NN00_9SPHN|nr:TonB-dependent receptor [Aurantiacibacter zhengii]RIV82814.1 TonB-dependent receptor [Aurantiacibacter zhengii]